MVEVGVAVAMIGMMMMTQQGGSCYSLVWYFFSAYCERGPTFSFKKCSVGCTVGRDINVFTTIYSNVTVLRQYTSPPPSIIVSTPNGLQQLVRFN